MSRYALVVHAHPEPQSFTSSLYRSALETLEAEGYIVQASDLYAMQFNPVASASDFGSRLNSDYLNYALEQRHNTQRQTLAPDIAGELFKLQRAELVLLVFPMYWCSVPAMLKGWIDRVLVSGVCYGGKRFYDAGGLRGKRALPVLALGAQEHMFANESSIHGDISIMLRPLLRGTLAYTGMDVLSPFLAWHVPYIRDTDRAALLLQFQERLRGLDREEPLSFPKLEQFDDRLRPI